MRLFVIFTLWQMYQVDKEIWVHPMNVERSRKGEYFTLYKDQRNFKDRFFENYRMTVQQFDYLLVNHSTAGNLLSWQNFLFPECPRDIIV